MIICAAIKVTDDPDRELIVCGHRHRDCFLTISQLNDSWTHTKRIQGFINHKGEFLDRKEALAHALECGQLCATTKWYQKDHNINELYSEDLY